MEISSIKKFLVIIPTAFMLSACSSDDEQEFAVNNCNNQNCVINLDNGESLIISDTTTYVLNLDEFNSNTMSCNIEKDLFTVKTKSANSTILHEYGYDSMEPESGWKKVLINKSWSIYGIKTPEIYIGRYVKVHKNLPIEEGTCANAANYSVEGAPQNVMGWAGNRIGFVPYLKTDYIADGVTRIFVIKSDLSGRVYNKNIPANPDDLYWVYELTEPVNPW